MSFSQNDHTRENLREGFTTGSAVSAAACAAVLRLRGMPVAQEVTIALPPFLSAEDLQPEQERKLSIPVAASGCGPASSAQAAQQDKGAPAGQDKETEWASPAGQDACAFGYAWATVIKDGGDDPDATHKARITVYASFGPLDEKTLSLLALTPGTPVVLPGCPGVTLYGAQGVGTVTLPGLPVPPGEPAINPEPRRQIVFAAREALSGQVPSLPLHLYIAVPEGEKISKRTLNPRLGITGGISILGTRGTVRPYSHAAWTATIEQSLSVAQALGIRAVMFTTGRRSERLGLAAVPGFPPQAAIQVADYAAFSIRASAKYDFRSLHWVCFPGKLLKLAQGLEWTHARSGEADIPLLAQYCREAGGDEAMIQAVAAMPTAVGAFAVMKKDRLVCSIVLERLARRAYATLLSWMHEGLKLEGKTYVPQINLHVFSLEDETLLLQLCEPEPA